MVKFAARLKLFILGAFLKNGIFIHRRISGNICYDVVKCPDLVADEHNLVADD